MPSEETPLRDRLCLFRFMRGAAAAAPPTGCSPHASCFSGLGCAPHLCLCPSEPTAPLVTRKMAEPPQAPQPARVGGVRVPGTLQERIDINNTLTRELVAVYVASEAR